MNNNFFALDHIIKCPDCFAFHCVKYGYQNGNQKYLCKKCLRTFEPDANKKKCSLSQINQIKYLYCEGMSYGKISNSLDIAKTTVFEIVKRYKFIRK